MKIRVNKLVGSWEMAESDRLQSPSRRPHASLVECDPQRIVVVDDEVMVRKAFSRVIADVLKDVMIDEAGNGAEALRLFQQHHHAVIVLDIHMPVMTGDRAFLEIQKFCSDSVWQMPSVVFCTGFDPPAGIRNIVSDDPIHCMLQKPVRNAVLIEAVSSRMPPRPVA